MIDAAAEPSASRASYASKRLGVILDAYTVYFDLWLCDLDGEVIANAVPTAITCAGATSP